MAYNPTTYVNDNPPAINAENLNKSEQGIRDCSLDVEENIESIDINNEFIRNGKYTISVYDLANISFDSNKKQTENNSRLTLKTLLRVKKGDWIEFDSGSIKMGYAFYEDGGQGQTHSSGWLTNVSGSSAEKHKKTTLNYSGYLYLTFAKSNTSAVITTADYDAVVTIYRNTNNMIIEENYSLLKIGAIELKKSLLDVASWDSKKKIVNHKRLTYYRLIEVKAGDKILYKTNNLLIGFAYYEGNHTWQTNSSGWLTAAEETAYIVPVDGYLVISIKKEDDSDVTIDDYDASIKIFCSYYNRVIRELDVAKFRNDSYHELGMSPIILDYESGSFNSSGDFADSTRLRQIGYMEIENDLRIICDPGYQIAFRVYKFNGTNYTHVAVGAEWTSYFETTRNLIEGNSIKIAIRKTDESDIGVDEASHIHIYGFNSGANSYFENPLFHNVCHRGFGVVAPENTIPAFAYARKVGFRYVETDVQFTSDDVPVILHDRSINRTSNGTGNIDEMTFETARSYDFGSWKNAIYAGTKIPSFEEFIAWCVRSGVKPYIELKTDVAYTQAQISQLVAIAKTYNILDECTWISFGISMLEKVHSIYAKARLGYLVRSKITAGNVTELLALRSENEVFFLPYASNHVIDTTTFPLAEAENIKIEACIIDTDELFANMDKRYSGNVTNGYPTTRKMWELANES